MNNPFLSDIFRKNYIDHFCDQRKVHHFKSIGGPHFYKHSLYPLYINLGRNLTKGINYWIRPNDIAAELRNKTCFIYDVPDFAGTKAGLLPKDFRLVRVKQYPGYFVDLKGFNKIDDYLKKYFSGPSRYKLRKYRRRLEQGFDLKEKMYHRKIDKKTFTEIFDHFRVLLKKRYSQKEIRNNNLDRKEWSFYKDVAYELILDGKATLFVIYDANTPISISFSYVYDTTLISAITVFDTDYSSFHPGSVSIWKQLEWCLDNNIDRFDFSKGHYDYKAQWATNRYWFEHHVLYDRRSIIASIIAYYIYTHQGLKQFFREKNLNQFYNKVRYRLNHLGTRKKDYQAYTSVACEDLPEEYRLLRIDRKDPEFHYIRYPLNSFVYRIRDHVDEIEIYHNPEDRRFFFKGKDTLECISYTTLP